MLAFLSTAEKRALGASPRENDSKQQIVERIPIYFLSQSRHTEL